MQTFQYIWRWVRWPLAILAISYVALVVWRVQVLQEEKKTAAAVAAIHADRLTQEDVFGPLVIEPDPVANSATLAGVDANKNGIRDDVERAIYFKYQDSAKTAAAAYQYAKALQKEFTHVYNSPTLVAVIQEQARGSLCLLDTQKDKEIEDLVFNTDLRKQARGEMYKKYMTSYGLPNNNECDLDISP